MIMTTIFMDAFAAMPTKYKSLKYGANSEAVFTSGTIIYKVFYTGTTSANAISLYNALTATGTALKFESVTANSTYEINFGEGVSFGTGLYVGVSTAADTFIVEYANS